MHLAELLHDLLLRLKTRQPIALPPAEELTLQEAAQLLQVSPAELIRLSEEGSLPHHFTGSRQMVYREDLLAYQAQMNLSETEGDPDNESKPR
ncbi:helix-turn-helix domain-containing protein [Deinococcus aquatilis]|uniref:helix-turn-helix domain-containing protein n=1 Tax=Deinococcus aquatilis TaxID=519440 RepID=UPI000365CFCB|nr:helix-turn-helix domain-containing protein [Deinococcus aquatilis]